MKIRKLLGIAYVGVFIPHDVVASSIKPWEALHEPGCGGWIVSVEESPHDAKHVVSGGDMLGTAVTFDGGESWKAGLGLPSYEMAQPTFHPTEKDVVWMASAIGPLVSKDGGRTWESRRNGMPEKSRWEYTAMIEKMLIDRRNPKHMLAFGGSSRRWKECRTQGAVWSSDDEGMRWSRLGTITTNGFVAAEVKGENIVSAFWGSGESAEVHIVTANGGWFVSADFGRSWTRREAKGAEGILQGVTLHPSDESVVWVTTAMNELGKDSKRKPGRIWKSTDGGRNFTSSDKGIATTRSKYGGLTTHYSSVAVEPTDPNALYVSDRSWASESIWRSRDGGANWEKVYSKGQSPTACYAGPGCKLSVSPSRKGVVYAFNSEYILKTVDGGNTWTDVTAMRPDANKPNCWRGRGWNGWCCHKAVFNPYRRGQSILLAMDAAHGWVSDDDLSSWRYVGGVSPWCAGNDAAFSKDGFAYIVTGQGGNNVGVIVSRDECSTWQTRIGRKVGLPDRNDGEYSTVAVNSENGREAWVANKGRLFKTEDGGETWNAINTSVSVGLLAEDPTKRGRRYMKNGQGVYVTEDMQNFTSIGMEGKSSGWLACDAKGRVLVCRSKGGDRSGMWRFDPQNRTWARLHDAKGAYAVATDPNDATRIMMTTIDYPYHDFASGEGVFVSSDDGATWQRANDGLHLHRLACCAFDPFDSERVVAGTEGGGFVIARWPRQMTKGNR